MAWSPRDTIKIRGVFVSFKTHTTTGWGTGVLRPDDGGEPIAIKGVIVGGRPGDSVEMEGYWTEHQTWGRAFAVTGCVPTAPQSADAVVAWMASKLPGIGESRAREMLAHFGGADQLWKVIEFSPERLAEIGGITASRAADIQQVYMEAIGDRDHMIALRGWGLTDSQVNKCKEAWKTLPNVVSQIRSNPFLLCFQVEGFGFKRADVVARRVGIGKDSVDRMVAGVVYTLEAAVVEGHCFLWGGQLQRMAAAILDVDQSIVGGGITEAWRRGYVVRRGKRIYSQRLERAEETCAQVVMRLLAGRNAKEQAFTGGGERVYH